MQKSKHSILRSFVLTFVVLLILVIIVPLFVRFSIDLTEHKATVESAVSEVLGRDVKVAGAITVTTSLWPYFEIHGISIANPKGFQKGDTASMDRARVTVGLLSLLQKRVRVRKFNVEGLTLDLQRNEGGDVNWAFEGLAAKEPQQPKKQSSPSSTALAVDDLLGIDLPPVEDYRLSAYLQASQGQFELSNIVVAVGDSKLNGNVVIDKTGVKPSATMELSADSIQLADFDTGDWSPDTPVSKQEKTESVSEAHASRASFLSPEVLQRVNAKWSVKVNEVLSGTDKLGSAEWSVELKDGRLVLDALRLNLPNSKLLLKASVKPDHVDSPASLRLLVENFDIGLLTRMHNPDSKVSGPLNIDLDVTSMARGIRGFLKGANGYFDISGTPANTSSGAVDLWAINLLSSVVESSAKKEKNHKVNCLISRWSLENGLMTTKNVAVDTSRIRICVKGDIDFNKQTIKLRAFPTAKRPEFFSLATPVAVNGKFEDFRVGAEMGVLSVVPTAVKFAISPITTPFKRLVREDLPTDGADICSLPIGPHEGKLEKLPGC